LADMYVQEIEDVRHDLHDPPFPLDEGSEHMRLFLVRMCLQALHPSPCESVQLQLHFLCEQLDSCMPSINAQATRADYDDGRDAKERWNSWIAEALLGGARRLHRWTRLPDGGALHQQCAEKADAKSLDQVVQVEAERLRKLWTATAWAPGPVRPVPEAEIIPLEELKWASGSFATFAAQSQDGFHPRHYSIAGERALQALAVILFAFERTTCLPEQLQWIVSFLLEKTGSRGY